MKTLIIGASTNPERYSYKAANRLLDQNYEVILAGIKKGSIRGIEIKPLEHINEVVDTITLYVNPDIQDAYATKIIELKPRRIIFNPGTENPELSKLAEAAGIETLEACTLVLLATKNY
jgi:hypothetical protein